MPIGTYVRGEGSFNAKLMIVGEAPGKHEEESGIPFVGQSGELLNEFLELSGSNRNQVYTTNVVKYRPPNNDFGRLEEIDVDLEQSRNDLFEEIRAIQPHCILGLGNQALRALCAKDKISLWRGSILESRPDSKGQTYKVVNTYHPANLLRGEDNAAVFKYSYKYVILNDIARAVNQSKFGDFRLPERSLEVCKSSLDFIRFLERSNLSKPCSVDIEASRCIPITIALSFDKSEAISIPLFNTLSHINYGGLATHELAHIWKLLADLFKNPDTKVIGQNFKYDQDKLARLGFNLNCFGDTLLLAHTINPEFPEKNLGFLSSIYTEEPFWKLEGKEFNPKVDRFDRLLLYNAKDAAVTLEVFYAMLAEAREKGLEEYFFECVMPRHKFYLDMERVGFRVDYEKREFLKEKYIGKFLTVHAETANLVGHEVNVESKGNNGQVCKLLYGELGLPLRYKRGNKWEQKTLSTDENTITALIANNTKDEKKQTILSNILQERKIRKTLSTYILAKPDYDGRMRTAYNITGAETDRTSTSNISAPIRPEKSMGLGFQTLTKHGEIGNDICEMFIPDDGMVFLNADLSQAEARVVFVLAEEWELLAKLDDPRFDIHWDTAKLCFIELPDVETCKKELGKEDPRRFIGKTLRHAGHLNMQKHTFMMNLNTDAKKYGFDLKISEWKAGKYLEAFHASCPNVRQVFHKGIENCLVTTRILRGPTLISPFDRPAPCGRYRMFFDRMSNELIKEALAEIPQHTVSNQTKFAGMRLKKLFPDVQFILEGHDALLAQVPKNDAVAYAREMKREMEKPIDFNSCSLARDYKLIIPADFQIGEKNYKDLEKLCL